MECDTTLIYDDPPFKAHLPKRKCIYPNIRQHPKNKMSAKKEYFTINFIHLIQKHVRFYLPLPNCVPVSIFMVSAFAFLTLSPNTPILFIAIPQHITISLILCFGYTALLKTLHNQFWSDAMPCHYDPK
jgi:hypothetical protein